MSKGFLHQELEVAQAGGGVKEGTRGSRVAKVFTTSFFGFSIMLSIGAVAFAIIFIICEVLGASMLLTYNANYNPAIGLRENTRDMVLVNQFMRVRNGNIITVHHHWGPNTTSGRAGEEPGLFIKRVIGVGNDRIRFERRCEPCWGGEWKDCIASHNFVENVSTPFRYRVLRNDIPIEENYRGFDHSHWGIMAFYGDNIYEYIQGRSRPHPTHNDFVPFRADVVKPHPTLSGVYEIVVPPGEIFFMGDNRGSPDRNDFWIHSYDSTAFGTQPVSLVQGVVIDHMVHDQTIPEFIWSRIVYFFTFRWLF